MRPTIIPGYMSRKLGVFNLYRDEVKDVWKKTSLPVDLRNRLLNLLFTNDLCNILSVPYFLQKRRIGLSNREKETVARRRCDSAVHSTVSPFWAFCG